MPSLSLSLSWFSLYIVKQIDPYNWPTGKAVNVRADKVTESSEPFKEVNEILLGIDYKSKLTEPDVTKDVIEKIEKIAADVVDNTHFINPILCIWFWCLSLWSFWWIKKIDAQ